MTLEQIIVAMYKEGKSTYEICDTLLKYGHTYYPNKINRMLRKSGVPLRTRSEAQTNVLLGDRREHPTRGKQLSIETKRKIGDAISGTYNEDPNNKNLKSERSKLHWKQMGLKEKRDLKRKAAKGVRRAAEEGSHVEKHVLYELRRAGYDVVFHSNMLIPRQSMQIDLFIPELKTVIEVDGPSHYKPIWGEEALAKMQQRDLIKNGLVLQYYNMIRLQTFCRRITNIYLRKTFSRLLPSLRYIQKYIQNTNELLPMEKRLIILEEPRHIPVIHD